MAVGSVMKTNASGGSWLAYRYRIIRFYLSDCFWPVSGFFLHVLSSFLKVFACFGDMSQDF